MVRLSRLSRYLLGGVAVMLCVPAGALAHEKEFAKFNACPSKTEGVAHCLYSVTSGGEILLGKKKTKIESPVTLQGGYSKENSETHISTFTAASGAETLVKTKENVEGGLLGIVPPEESPALVKLLSKYFFEHGLTQVFATLELAKPASEIEVSNFNLLLGEGLALRLPVKVHLENAFLGSSCYVGSSGSPIIWNLTTGKTSPSAPNTSIEGKPGFPETKEEFRIAQVNENTLVENNWSAPQASGCGGILSFLVDPVLDLMLGSTTAGHNTAILNNTIDTATATAVNNH
jgi:hypothetical protein